MSDELISTAQRDVLAKLASALHDNFYLAGGVGQRKYPVEDIGHVVRSLSYFGDAESQPFPRGLEPESWSQIRRDFERWTLALVADPTNA